MPLPTPDPKEPRSKFISRCMRNTQSKKDFPDTKQRLAVCFSKFEEKRGKDKRKDKASGTV